MDRELTRFAALNLHDTGYGVVPLVGKAPAFKGARALTRDQIQELFRSRDFNIGIKLKPPLVAVDCDSLEAEEFVRSELGLVSSMCVRSSRGINLLMRHDLEKPRTIQKFLGKPIDVLFANHLVVPPSYVKKTAWRYEWTPDTRVVPPDRLPLFPRELMPKQPEYRPVQMPAGGSGQNDREYQRAMKYVLSPNTPGAISGQKGHSRTFYIANRLLVLFPSLTFEQLRSCLKVFNTKCEPPWNSGELDHKAKDAWKKVRGA